MQTDGGIAYSVAAQTQGTCRETCAAVPLFTGAVCLSEFSSANSSDKLSWSIEHVTKLFNFPGSPRGTVHDTSYLGRTVTLTSAKRCTLCHCDGEPFQQREI